MRAPVFFSEHEILGVVPAKAAKQPKSQDP
jgi:hypothetical protein